MCPKLYLVLRYREYSVLKIIQSKRKISNYNNVCVVRSYWPRLCQFRNDHNLGKVWGKDCICGSLENMSFKQTKKGKMKALTIPLPKNTNDLKVHKSIHWHDIAMKAESHFDEQIRYQSTHRRRASLWTALLPSKLKGWNLQKGRVN